MTKNKDHDNNIIYILNLEIISLDIANLFIKSLKIKYNTIYLNKDNSVIINNIFKITIRSIQLLLEKNNDICFNNYSNISACPQCNFQYCDNCIMKIKK